MAATRFYFPTESSGIPKISPAFDAEWKQNGQATLLKLLYIRQGTSATTNFALTTLTTGLNPRGRKDKIIWQ